VRKIHAATFHDGGDVSQFNICDEVPSFGKKERNHNTSAIAMMSANPAEYIAA